MTRDRRDTADFGFEDIPLKDKVRRVRGVFDSVADRYDLMNDLMSGGAHRLWKQFTLSLTGLKSGGRALDIAGGTGDLAAGLARQVGRTGLVVLADGLDRTHADVLLAEHQHALAGAVPAHFGGRRVHPQVFKR